MALGNLAQRAIVGVIALPILLLTVYQTSPHFTWALAFAAAILALREFLAMTLKDPREVRDVLIIGAVASAALYWLAPVPLGIKNRASFMAVLQFGPLVAIFLATVPVGLYFLFRFRTIETVAPRMAYAWAGIVYVGFLATFLALIKRDFGSAGGDLVILVLLIAWVGDTGAYFAGRFLGKSKLYEAVSPKKTWAGAWGGLAGSVVAAAIMKLTRIESLHWLDVVFIAVPGAILGQLGDLAESLVKRSVGVKDSGALLPGHGGMLDRIDAVLFIAPYTYVYLQIASWLPWH